MSQRLCIVDRRTELQPTELQTCVRCLGQTRRDLLDITDLYALLPAELEGRAGASTPPEPNGHIHGEGDPLPGGDVMVMLGPGSTGHHGDPADGDSVLGLLERWDTDWRITLGFPAANEPATVARCIEFLLRNLERMAQWGPTRKTDMIES